MNQAKKKSSETKNRIERTTEPYVTVPETPCEVWRIERREYQPVYGSARRSPRYNGFRTEAIKFQPANRSFHPESYHSEPVRCRRLQLQLLLNNNIITLEQRNIRAIAAVQLEYPKINLATLRGYIGGIQKIHGRIFVEKVERSKVNRR